VNLEAKKMKRQILISAVSVFILGQACLSQSAEPTDKSPNFKRVKKLIVERYRIKALLADHKRMQSLPDANERLAEYKEKLEQIKKPEVKHIPPSVAKKRDEEWKKFKEMHGDEWRQIYGKMRGVVSTLVFIDVLNTEIEPFLRIMHIGAIDEPTKEFFALLGMDKSTDPDKIWQAVKEVFIIFRKCYMIFRMPCLSRPVISRTRRKNCTPLDTATLLSHYQRKKGKRGKKSLVAFKAG